MKEDVYTRFCKMCGVPDPATFPPADEIPCTEFSDPHRLCVRPLVSVMMTTYNHAKWVRQAIEGVICQKTDFEYEVIVGDDASTDGTLGICLEYQQHYPDKIRVLWSAENVFAIGGNARRIQSRCRGEFVAICEGDDYWTDPEKLQKQMDLIRRHTAIGCVAFSRRQKTNGETVLKTPESANLLDWRKLTYYHTSTYLFKKEICDRFPDIRKWYDSVVQYVMISLGPVCVLKEPVSVYRQTGEGVWTGANLCWQKLMNLGLYVDLYAHGPRHVPALRRQFAHAALRRIAQFARNKDVECRKFLMAHRPELRSAFDEIWHGQPLLVRVLWIRLWFRRP